MTVYYSRKTLLDLCEDLIVATADGRDCEGLHLFVKCKPEAAMSAVTTALAKIIGDDVEMLKEGEDE